MFMREIYFLQPHCHCHSCAQQVREEEDHHLKRIVPPEHAMDTGGDMLAGQRTLESGACKYLVIMNIPIIYIHLTFMYIKAT